MDLDLHRLRSESFVAHVEHHDELGSTNDRARRLAAVSSGTPPALVIAQRQTAGRGRGTNRWWTGPGSLAFSLLFDPGARGIERRYFSMLSLAAALSIVDTSAPRAAGAVLGVHWPNDVFASGRKLAGVLVEALADGRHIVGVGWNVNNSTREAPGELAGIVTTLRDLTGHEHDRTELLLEMLLRLDGWLERMAHEPAVVGRRADAACLQRGQELTIEAGSQRTTGKCAGIAADGALLLDTAAGRESHYCGVLTRIKPCLSSP
jgi:BirA family biotin operon repressor/biotin-[acetyl-CoA-carboxylase] ligase